MENRFEIIAERRITDTDPERMPIIVRLGKPKKVKNGEWKCAYQISGLKSEKVQYAYGIDGIQSIIMAIEGMRSYIEKLDRCFSWEGGESGDTGFPRFVPTFFGLEFYNRICGIIEREIDKYTRSVKKKSGGVRKKTTSACG